MSRALDWERDRRLWPHHDASRFVQAGGLRWHVQVTGRGPAALLIHGTGASTHSWRGIMPLLSPHFTVVSLDLPGHGFTSRPGASRFSLPAMAVTVGALVDELGIDVELCLGHSAGAAIGMRMALDGLIRPQVLLAANGAFFPLEGLPGLTFPFAARAMASTRIAPALFAWRASESTAVQRVIASTGSNLDAEGMALYAMLMRDAGHVASALDMMAQWDLRPLARDLRRLRTPLALMVGSNDRAVPPGGARRAISMLPPGTPSTLTVLDGAGHLAHEERPAAAARWVQQARAMAASGGNRG